MRPRFECLNPAPVRPVHSRVSQLPNLWTEYIPTPDQAEYMAYPRAIAMAEVLWSPPELRDLRHFLARLPHALRRLDRLGVAYRVPDLTR